MNNNCPTCGSTYNLTPEHVGRSFTCQRCNSNLVVEPSGLSLVGGGGPQQPAPGHPSGGAQGQYGAGQPAGQGGYSGGGIPKPGENLLLDYLLFRKMVVPIIIQILFWIALLVGEGFGLFLLVMSFSARGGVFLAFMGSLMYLIFFPVLLRLYAELIIIIFRIYDTLQDISKHLKEKQ